MQKKDRRLPELLSPAGSYDALRAAIEGGADAIYVGSTAFNARMRAKNFGEDELKKGIELAHTYGVKVYIAANTLIYDRELDDYLRAAERAYLLGVDAMIIADIGAASEVKRRVPIELHASTQASGHNVEAAKRLYEMGFSRMVLAREMPKEDIALFCKESPIESEVFVHGALCVCHSGQCLFSSVVGGRSGNRGECAQPCRLPYRVRGKKGDSYPLSLKDLSLAEHITELCEMGVSSLKIEGRMKSPEYVREVTAKWRELLDAQRNADERDMEYLARVFGRGGHTDGYFVRKIDSKMLGVRSEIDKKESAEQEKFENITRKIPIGLSAVIKQGKPAMLTAKTAEKSVTVTGSVPEIARTAPISEDTVKRSLAKLGDTPYCLNDINIELDGGLMLPVSALNALRREAIAGLCKDNARSENDLNAFERRYPMKKREKMRSAVFYNAKSVTKKALEFFNTIYIPLENYSECAFDGMGVMLPEVIFDGERERVSELLKGAYDMGARDALIGNVGHIDLVKELSFRLHGDIRLNLTNNSSVAYYEGLGFEDVILSPELTLPQARDIGGASAVCVYGRLPLMVTEKCVGKEIGGCELCESGRAVLTDRRGVEFPILRRYPHRSVIVNSVPTYMADKRSELERAGVVFEHFIFTTEKNDEVDAIIELYKSRKTPNFACRRVK